jgi:flavin reductase (DIM6/NTAB) family NADH-FMN oxidoreductase RutF
MTLVASSVPGAVTPHRFRAAARRFGTGVTVLTVPAGGARPAHGMTANAFMTVSLRPPLVGVGVRGDGQTSRAVRDRGSFGLSVLAAGQRDLAVHFADPERAPGPAQFAGIGWRPGAATGAPLLAGALAWFECSVAGTVEAGDHELVLGHVLTVDRGAAAEPLLFFDGGYHRVAC